MCQHIFYRIGYGLVIAREISQSFITFRIKTAGVRRLIAHPGNVAVIFLLVGNLCLASVLRFI